ncbi:hypothetical protein M5K25_011164 [Dendrobium thyrsiflorum]|uniref:FAM91 N-terminal domain-containing protein n=1 Tax=Dendrobium thyrsiflorum TaxID=117978 RepID=A0ABD0V8Y9_DENTH
MAYIIIENCIKKRLQWNTCFARKICKEGEYYEEMMRYLRKNLALFPYHLAEYVCRVMRISPFKFYCDMIFEVMRNGHGEPIGTTKQRWKAKTQGEQAMRASRAVAFCGWLVGFPENCSGEFFLWLAGGFPECSVGFPLPFAVADGLLPELLGTGLIPRFLAVLQPWLFVAGWWVFPRTVLGSFFCGWLVVFPNVLLAFPLPFAVGSREVLMADIFLYIVADMRHLGEQPYDSIPNFSAADALRLTGIGRNEFIDIMNKCRSKVPLLTVVYDGILNCLAVFALVLFGFG